MARPDNSGAAAGGYRRRLRSGEVRSSSSSSTAARRESTSQQESNAPSSVVGPDNSTQPQSWASAGLSVAAATAASSVMPRLNLPKKVSIGSKRNTLLTTPHSSVEQTTSAADVSTGKHVTVSHHTVFLCLWISF